VGFGMLHPLIHNHYDDEMIDPYKKHTKEFTLLTKTLTYSKPK
jgi:hypothetical protein